MKTMCRCYVLGIRKKASNLAVRLELGRLPVENFNKSQILLSKTASVRNEFIG
jgi:hypothetical protein